jgi:hypothetical protein
MNTNIAIIAALLAACSAPAPEATPDQLELADVEAALSVNSSKYGISTAVSHLTCRSDGPTGQDCLVPRSKTIQYCYSNGGGSWTASEISAIENYGVGTLAGDFPGFTFGRGHIGDQTACRTGSGLFNKITKGGCSGGSTGSNVENFVCYQPAIQLSLPDLTESLPGRWRYQEGGFITADLGAITESNCVLGHGVSKALANAAGFGSDSSVADSLGQLHTTRAIAPKSWCQFGTCTCGHAQSSAQEQCFAASVASVSNGVMTFNATTCAP